MTKSVLNLEKITRDMRYRVIYYATVAGGFLIIAVLASLVLIPLGMIDYPEKFTFIEFLFYLFCASDVLFVAVAIGAAVLAVRANKMLKEGRITVEKATLTDIKERYRWWLKYHHNRMGTFLCFSNGAWLHSTRALESENYCVGEEFYITAFESNPQKAICLYSAKQSEFKPYARENTEDF